MLLAHDRPLLHNKIKPHLKYVPSYLMPRELVKEQMKANAIQGEKNIQANTQTTKKGFLTKVLTHHPLALNPLSRTHNGPNPKFLEKRQEGSPEELLGGRCRTQTRYDGGRL